MQHKVRFFLCTEIVSNLNMIPVAVPAPLYLQRIAAKLSACLLILFVSSTSIAQQGQANTDEVSRFKTIYDVMQRDSTPETFKKAYGLLAEFKKAYPTSPYALIALGEIKYREAANFKKPGALEEATALAQQAMKMNQKIADPYILLTKLYVEKQDGPNAKEMAKRAFYLEPTRPETLAAMGRASQQNREFEQAAEWNEKAAEAFTDPIRKSNMYWWVYHALSDSERVPMDRRADMPKIQEALEKAIHLHPADSSMNKFYGCFLVERKGDLKQGRKYLELALNNAVYLQEILHCRSLADYLEWALSPSNGDTKSSLESIAAKTGMSIEDAFVEAAAYDGLTPIPTAMLRAKVIANLNTIGSGVSRNHVGCCSALVNAAFDGNLPLLKQLVEAGANLHAEDPTGRTALFYAIYSADVDMVEYLLQKGARPNIRDQFGATPLYDSVFAAQKNQTKLVKVLLKYKANPIAPTAAGLAFAPYAVAMATQTTPPLNGLDLLKAFVEDGHVDINLQNADGGITFLAVAVYDANLVRYLLAHGANPTVKIKGQDIVDFYAPQLASGFRDFRLNQLESSLKLIQDAQKRNAAK